MLRRTMLLALVIVFLATPTFALPVDWTQGFATDCVLSQDLWEPGTCALDDSAIGHHPLWDTGGDATGDGVSMLVNGFTDKPQSLVWGMNLDLGVDPFVVFAKNVCCVDKPGRPGPKLEFWFDGFFQSALQTDGAGHWDVFSFIPPVMRGTHTYEIRNGSIVFDGNDFALDFAQPVPEPATLTLLGGSLAATWALRRRRQNGTANA